MYIQHSKLSQLKLYVWVIWLPIVAGCDMCRNHKTLGNTFVVKVMHEEDQIYFLGKTKPRISIILQLTAHEEVASDMKFKLASWTSHSGMKGALFNASNEEITKKLMLRKGYNIFYYVPKTAGTHLLSFVVRSNIDDTKREVATKGIIVKKKSVRFAL